MVKYSGLILLIAIALVIAFQVNEARAQEFPVFPVVSILPPQTEAAVVVVAETVGCDTEAVVLEYRLEANTSVDWTDIVAGACSEVVGEYLLEGLTANTDYAVRTSVSLPGSGISLSTLEVFRTAPEAARVGTLTVVRYAGAIVASLEIETCNNVNHSVVYEYYLYPGNVADTYYDNDFYNYSSESLANNTDGNFSGLTHSTQYALKARRLCIWAGGPGGYTYSGQFARARLYTRDRTLSNLRVDQIGFTQARIRVYYDTDRSSTVSISANPSAGGASRSGSVSVQTRGTVEFNLTGLVQGTGYNLTVSLAGASDASATFTTTAGTIINLTVTDLGAYSVTLGATVDTETSGVRFSVTPTGGRAITHDVPASSAGAIFYTFTGLTFSTDYAVRVTFATGGGGTPLTGSFTTEAETSSRRCTATLATTIALGTLGINHGDILPTDAPYSGAIDGNRETAVCSDADGRSSQYFSFTLGAGDGGGVLLTAVSNALIEDHLTPEIRILPAVGGNPTYENAETNDNESRLGVVMDAGTYIAQVRSTQEIAGSQEGKGGAYLMSVRRIYPGPANVVFSVDSLSILYDVWTLAPNMIMDVDYKAQSSATWISLLTGAQNTPVGERDTRYISAAKDELSGQTGYDIRAKFKHAGNDQYSEAQGFTIDRVAFPAPKRPSFDDPVYSVPGEDFSVTVTATWVYPEVRLVDGGGDGSKWFWQMDWGGRFVDGSRSLAAAVTFYEADLNRNVPVRVRGVFECVDDSDGSDEPCNVYVAGLNDLSVDEDRSAIPEGETWYSVWSGTNVFAVRGDHIEIPTTLDLDPDALPAVVDAIDSLMASMGVSEDARRPEIWAFLLCFIVAVGLGVVAFYATGGLRHVLWSSVLGALLFFIVYVLAGPVWFGIAPLFAYSTLVVPLMLAVLAGLSKVKT